MANTRKSIALLLALVLSIGFALIDNTRAYSSGTPSFPKRERSVDDKLSSDLLQRIGSPRVYDLNSYELSQSGEDRVRVILQLKGKHRRAIDPLLDDQGVSVRDDLQ